MEQEEFRNEFLADVRTRANADKNFMHSAFTERSGELLGEAEELYDFEACYFRGTGSKNRGLAVDGFSFDDADGSVRIVVAEFEGGRDPKTLIQSYARTLFGRTQAFVEDSLSGRVQQNSEESSPEYGLARELEHRAGSISRIRFFLVTDSVLSDRVKDWPEGDIGGIPTEFHIWDISRFHRAHLSRSGRDELIVDFAAACESGLPCIRASVSADNYSAYLCVIPGNVLADIYDTYGSRLLEGNVRSFLSTGVKVNKGIRNTILKEPEMFFAYNNGIAATASGVRVEEIKGAYRLLEATDLQIVNGGQTTASLSNTRRKDSQTLDGIFVPMKLSVVNEETSGTVIPLISRYANSQNKVSEADFFANHDYHRRIESISRRLRAPARAGSQLETFWFYERARGQYSVELGKGTAAAKKRFETDHPRDQLLTKTDLAKIENSWRQLPHDVSKGAQKNFLKFAEYVTAEWERSPDEFNDEYFKAVVARALIFKLLERLVPKQEWYDGGYRANIVAFSLAKLANMIQEEAVGKTLNTTLIWREQRVSSVLENQLLLIAKGMYSIIIAPEAGIQNVTEWSKRELAWTRAKDFDVEFLSEFRKELDQKSEERARQKDAREGAKIGAGLEATTAVLSYGAEKWEKLRKWGKERSLISPGDEKIISVAINPKKIPTDWQSAELLKLKQRMEEDGF
jgi:hypothetical protein